MARFCAKHMSKLVKDLNLFHLKNTLKTLVDKEKDVKASVNSLINQSMLSFYFEKIGDTILAIRKAIEIGEEDRRLLEYRDKLEELVEAYNLYADEKIKVEKVLPRELQVHLGFGKGQ